MSFLVHFGSHSTSEEINRCPVRIFIPNSTNAEANASYALALSDMFDSYAIHTLNAPASICLCCSRAPFLLSC